MRQDYRRIAVGFASEPPRRDFDIRGVFHIQTSGRQMVVWTASDADVIIEQARSLEAVSIDVTPVSLRELFLSKVKEL